MELNTPKDQGVNWMNLFNILGAVLFTGLVMWLGYVGLQANTWPQWLQMIVAIIWGVGGVIGVFAVAGLVLDQLPTTWKSRFTPLVFVGPALAILGWFLGMPVIRTIYMSLMDGSSRKFVGFDNYLYAVTNSAMREALRNNVLWLIIGTGCCVGIALLIAFLTDRTPPVFEGIIQTLIFLPMAISMVGASVIWRFVYAFEPGGAAQVGILNAIVTAFGGEPVAWLMLRPWNTIFLILVLVWMQTGFAMVILSAAVKGIPEQLLEAGRIDGANELEIIGYISIPYIRGTIITVATMTLILTLKVFDIVFTMTGGRYGTEVIANQFYVQMFRSFQYGRGSAIAVLLLIAVLPVMWYNLRHFNQQQGESFR